MNAQSGGAGALIGDRGAAVFAQCDEFTSESDPGPPPPVQGFSPFKYIELDCRLTVWCGSQGLRAGGCAVAPDRTIPVSGRTDQLKLGAFIHPTGSHVAAWLHPDSQADAGINLAHYAELARTAERGLFDLMFIRDSAATRDGRLDALKRWPTYMVHFEPITLLSALAALTTRLGLVATATTSYNEPYTIARKFASLDHLSGGRAGWNVVTSSNRSESFNFGREVHYAHGERYARAHEFVDVVRGLWDSWDDDAFLRDRATAIYFEPEKLHVLEHRGAHFSVRGPLNIPRPPQGHPVIAQAGASEEGLELAARTAEIVFTPLGSLDAARSFRADLKGRVERHGRRPEDLKVMPGLNPVIGRTEAEAREKHEYLQSLIHPDVGRQLLSEDLGGIDLSDVPLDAPLPFDRLPATITGGKTTFRTVVEMARAGNLTLRQLYEKYGGARGHHTLIGTPQQIADHIEAWFKGEGVDGFLVQPPVLPGGLTDFVDLVVPELQRRGIFRTRYEGATLRENLGLPRPPGRYRQQSPTAAEGDASPRSRAAP